MGKVKPEDCFSERELMDYKEAFTVIDKDGDGEISVKELKACYNELGEKCKDDELKEMVAEAKGPLNYQAFIGLFADKLNGTDPEAMMMEAFKCLDNGNKGEFSISDLKEMLTQMGRPSDRLTEAEFNLSLEGAPVKDNSLAYASYTQLIKNGKCE